MASSARIVSSRFLHTLCQRSAVPSCRAATFVCTVHVRSPSTVVPTHRCSALCLVHSASFSSASPSVSRSPIPASSSLHHRSSSIADDSFHPADPEVEGYKTRLSVERRVYSAISSLPKLADNATLRAARPPRDDIQIDWWPLGHDDPLAVLRLDQLDLDSLDKVELLTAVEKEFGVEFSDQQYEKFSTAGHIIEALLWNPNTK